VPVSATDSDHIDRSVINLDVATCHLRTGPVAAADFAARVLAAR
jgi:hypothetical protein